ncbi:MAG: hypothetical protein WD049_01700 [Candidatus Paceibacterota bacterium]
MNQKLISRRGNIFRIAVIFVGVLIVVLLSAIGYLVASSNDYFAFKDKNTPPDLPYDCQFSSDQNECAKDPSYTWIQKEGIGLRVWVAECIKGENCSHASTPYFNKDEQALLYTYVGESDATILLKKFHKQPTEPVESVISEINREIPFLIADGAACTLEELEKSDTFTRYLLKPTEETAQKWKNKTKNTEYLPRIPCGTNAVYYLETREDHPSIVLLFMLGQAPPPFDASSVEIIEGDH